MTFLNRQIEENIVLTLAMTSCILIAQYFEGPSLIGRLKMKYFSENHYQYDLLTLQLEIYILFHFHIYIFQTHQML